MKKGKAMARLSALTILVASLLAGAAGLSAQATPAEKARDVIRGLTSRTSLPPVQELGRLESAPAEVCREIGLQLARMHPETAQRVAHNIASSNNSFAHAALLVAMATPDETIRRTCVDALVTIPFGRIAELGPAASQMQPRLFEQLREDGHWEATIVDKVTQLCSQDDRNRESAALRHQQIALALVVDLYGGERGYATLVNQLLKLMVGEAAPEPPPPTAEPEEADEDADKDEEAEEVEAGPTPLTADEERVRIMHERRRGAIAMFRRILVIDPDGFFQLGESAPYEKRVERAAEFWARYGGVEGDENAGRDGDRGRLISSSYVERNGPVTTWRGHISWVQREAATRDEQVMALVLMDELCGGIQVDAPKAPRPAPKPGEEVEEDEGPMTVPAITGETPASKVGNFLALDLRTGQRPRIRAIRAAFEEKFGKK